jgi:lysine 2,3-aminomutase
MKGINDTPQIMKELLQQLLKIRVRPYYIHHMDLTCGTAHFRTSIKTGTEIIKSLVGHTSGLCVPHYVIDLPGGGGKVPITPENILGTENSCLVLENYQNKIFKYPLSGEDLIEFNNYQQDNRR